MLLDQQPPLLRLVLAGQVPAPSVALDVGLDQPGIRLCLPVERESQCEEPVVTPEIDTAGISLDQENQTDKVKAFLAEQKMPWPQVYDGKFWNATVAKQYGIDSIPHAFLIDGNMAVVHNSTIFFTEKLPRRQWQI